MALKYDTAVEIIPLRYYPEGSIGYEPINGIVIGAVRVFFFFTRYKVAYPAWHEGYNRMVTAYDYFKKSELIEIYE